MNNAYNELFECDYLTVIYPSDRQLFCDKKLYFGTFGQFHKFPQTKYLSDIFTKKVRIFLTWVSFVFVFFFRGKNTDVLGSNAAYLLSSTALSNFLIPYQE